MYLRKRNERLKTNSCERSWTASNNELPPREILMLEPVNRAATLKHPSRLPYMQQQRWVGFIR